MPIFMKFGSVRGDAKGKYKGWIELQSAQFGIAPNGNGHSASPSQGLSEIVCAKQQDSSSSELLRNSLWGEGVEVTIEFVRPGFLQTPYLKVDLENVLITNYAPSGHGGSAQDRPAEDFSLNYTKKTMTVIAVSVPTRQ